MVDSFNAARVDRVESLHLLFENLLCCAFECGHREEWLTRDPRPVGSTHGSVEAPDEDDDVSELDLLRYVEPRLVHVPVLQHGPQDAATPVNRFLPFEQVADYAVFGPSGFSLP
jgi:hypothetical protein